MVSFLYLILAMVALTILGKLVIEGIQTFRSLKNYQGESRRLMMLITASFLTPGLLLMWQIIIEILVRTVPAQVLLLRQITLYSYVLLLLPLIFWKWSLQLRPVWSKVSAWMFGLFCTHMIAGFLQKSRYVYSLSWTLIPWVLFLISLSVVVVLAITAYQLLEARDEVGYG